MIKTNYKIKIFLNFYELWILKSLFINFKFNSLLLYFYLLKLIIKFIEIISKNE